MATLPQIASAERPQLSYRTQRKFEMREASFPSETIEAIKLWLYKQIETRRRQLEQRHKRLVPEWRRIAEGKPRDERKSWPFENCANLVHQIVGEASDDLSARVMGLIWATAPIILYRYFTQTNDSEQATRNSKKSDELQRFMDYVAYEPAELDLYERENIWFSDSAKLGTAWLAIVPEERVEAVYIGYEAGEKKTKFEEATLYEGPRVLNLRDEDVLYDPQADQPEDSDFFSRRVTLTKRQLQEREFRGLYKKGSVVKIADRPDRYGPERAKQKQDKSKGTTHVEEAVLAEWDMEESYFYWYHNRKKYRLISWFHYETKTLMNLVFNFIPENQIPIVRTRLASDEKGMNGRGLADMGQYAQEEISTTKNQRIDATTWIMLGVNRISSMNKNIDRNFKVFPGATMPFGKDEFEHIAVGDASTISASQANEQMMIQQARERFGIGPAVAGMGAGAMQGRGRNAFFGSMGTMAVMQDANTRVAHRTSDFRHSHVRLFGLLTDFYGAMDLGRKGTSFGLDDNLLREALEDYLERKVRIPIRAATASANREVTKQTQMIFNQQLELFVERMMQKLQAVNNPQIPEPYKKWLRSVVKGQIRLMQQTIRDFQLSEQPEEYVPSLEFPEEQQQKGAPNAPTQAGIDPRIAEISSRLRQAGGVSVPSGVGGMEERGGGPSAAPRGTGL